MVKINGTTANMLVDSGAQSTVLGDRQLNVTKKPAYVHVLYMGMVVYQLWVYVEAAIECHGKETIGTVCCMFGPELAEGAWQECIWLAVALSSLIWISGYLDIIEKVTVPITWVSPAVIAPIQTKTT